MITRLYCIDFTSLLSTGSHSQRNLFFLISRTTGSMAGTRRRDASQNQLIQQIDKDGMRNNSNPTRCKGNLLKSLENHIPPVVFVHRLVGIQKEVTYRYQKLRHHVPDYQHVQCLAENISSSGMMSTQTRDSIVLGQCSQDGRHQYHTSQTVQEPIVFGNRSSKDDTG